MNNFIKSHVKSDHDIMQLGNSKSRLLLGNKIAVNGNRNNTLKISLNTMLNGLSEEQQREESMSNGGAYGMSHSNSR